MSFHFQRTIFGEDHIGHKPYRLRPCQPQKNRPQTVS